MVNPVKYYLKTENGEHLVTIEPVYEEIAGGDLFATGRYILSEGGTEIGEIRFDGELFEWEWNGNPPFADENIYSIVNFIKEYNEPELVFDFD